MDKWDRVVLFLAFFCAVALVIGSFAFVVTNIQEREPVRDSVCMKMADLKGLTFYEQSIGRCGQGELCSYQCKFLDSKGDIVIKNVR